MIDIDKFNSLYIILTKIAEKDYSGFFLFFLKKNVLEKNPQVFQNYFLHVNKACIFFTLILTVLGVINSLDMLSICSVASLLHIWNISCKTNETQ